MGITFHDNVPNSYREAINILNTSPTFRDISNNAGNVTITAHPFYSPNSGSPAWSKPIGIYKDAFTKDGRKLLDPEFHKTGWQVNIHPQSGSLIDERMATLPELIAHEFAHGALPSEGMGGFLSNGNEIQTVIITNQIRSDLNQLGLHQRYDLDASGSSAVGSSIRYVDFEVGVCVHEDEYGRITTQPINGHILKPTDGHLNYSEYSGYNRSFNLNYDGSLKDFASNGTLGGVLGDSFYTSNASLSFSDNVNSLTENFGSFGGNVLYDTSSFGSNTNPFNGLSFGNDNSFSSNNFLYSTSSLNFPTFGSSNFGFGNSFGPATSSVDFSSIGSSFNFGSNIGYDNFGSFDNSFNLNNSFDFGTPTSFSNDFSLGNSGFSSFGNFGSFGGGLSFSFPIILDLDGTGVEITELGNSTMFMDAEGDGLLHRTAWAAAGNGVLFIDTDPNDGVEGITERRQYVFTEWDPTATSDMEALRSVFDSNGDGVLNASDTAFSQFRVLETNADGSTSVRTLTELGITEINLTDDATNIELPDGSVITGQTTFTYANGTTGTVANTTLASETQGYNVVQDESTNGNGEREVVSTAYADDGSVVYAVTSVTTPSGNRVENSYDDNGDGVVDRIQIIETVGATETVTNSLGASEGVAILQDATATTRSANGSVTTIERDTSGGGWYDEREVRTNLPDGSRTVEITNMAQDGTVVRHSSEAVSVDGLTRSTAVDEDGDGDVDVTIAHVITVHADGSRTEVISETNGDGTPRSSVTEVISADGRVKTITRNLDGEGEGDTIEELRITINADGTTESVLTVKNQDGSIRSSVTHDQSADALTQTSASDLDGINGADVAVRDETILNADGSRVQTITTTNNDGSIRDLERVTLGADRVSSETWIDLDQGGLDQNGDFEATDLVRSVSVDATTNERITQVWDRNPDGSFVSRSTTITSADGLTENTEVFEDGDNKADTLISDVTVSNANGSSTQTVETRNQIGSLRDSTVTTTSADGLVVTTTTDIGGVDVRVVDTRLRNADGSVTRTVSEFAGDETTLLSHTVTTESADRRTVTVTRDSNFNGDGHIDNAIYSVEAADGSTTINEYSYNLDGTVVSHSQSAISANGLITTTQIDANGDETFETSVTDEILLNADGSRTIANDVNNFDGSNRSLTVTEISDDGLTTTVETDANGDGVFERSVTAETELRDDGHVIETTTVRASDGTRLSRSELNVTDDGLTETTRLDTDGVGIYDQINVTGTVLQNDGGTETTSSNFYIYNNSYVLLDRTTVTASDDGRSINTEIDVNGDTKSDTVISETVADTGTRTVVQSERNADGTLQSQTETETSDDGLTVTISGNLDGDTIFERVVNDVTVLRANGSTMRTVSQADADGDVYSWSDILTSDDGLVITTRENWNNNASIDLTTINTTSVSSDGERTNTIERRAANGSVIDLSTTVTSADGRTITETYDLEGDDLEEDDIAENVTKTEIGYDGTTTTTANHYATHGGLEATYISTVSGDGLRLTQATDRNADGEVELFTTDTTTLDETGSVSRTVEHRNEHHISLGNEAYFTSDDGLFTSISYDFNGDNVFDYVTHDTTMFRVDGRVDRVQTTHTEALAPRSHIFTNISANGLEETVETDYSGDTIRDRIRTNTQLADGSWTETHREYANDGVTVTRSDVTSVTADGRTRTVTSDLDGVSGTDRIVSSLTDFDRTVVTTYRDFTQSGSLASQVTGTRHANGTLEEFAYNIDGDNDIDLTRSTATSFGADGEEVVTYTETYGANSVYSETTTNAADGLSSTTTFDVDGDEVNDGTATSETTLNNDGSRLWENQTLYASGDLRLHETRFTSADGRTIRETFDYDGNGINDRTTDTVINSAGERVETDRAFNEGGLPGETFITTTSADGLVTTIQRWGNVEVITRSPIGNGSYTWDNGVTDTNTAVNVVVSHEFDALGIETWSGTFSNRSNPVSVRLDAEAKQDILDKAARIYDAVLDRDMGFAEIEALVLQITDGELDEASLIENLIDSDEFSTRYGTLTDAEFVTQISLNTYGRAPSLTELNTYINDLGSGAHTREQIALEMSESIEHLVVGNNHIATNNFDVIINPAAFERNLDKAYLRSVIANIVDVVYDRDPTEQELDYLLGELLKDVVNPEDAVTLEDIVNTLLNVDGDIQGVSTSSLSGLSGNALVVRAFQNAGIQPTSIEQAAWEANLSSGRISNAQFIASLSQSVEHLSVGNSHSDTIANVTTHNGSAGADTLNGTDSQDTLSGYTGNDIINGHGGSDHLAGNIGDDTLNGGDGNDRYFWSEGHGSDTINDNSVNITEVDTLVLTDISSTEVALTRAHGSNDLLITIKDNDVITVTNRFANTAQGYGLEAIEFSDGITWTLDDILSHTQLSAPSSGNTRSGTHYRDNISGGAGDDIIYGHLGDDLITGGMGTDTLYGGGGGDTYFWSRGDGSDTINDDGASFTDVDRLVLIDVASTDVILSHASAGNDLIITIPNPDGNAEVITVINRFFGNVDGRGVEVIEFSDDVVWSLDEILAQTDVVSVTLLVGHNYRDNLYGGDNANLLQGNNGDDHLYGGKGNDNLQGGNGSDTYYWSKSDGNDRLEDVGASADEVDKLILRDVTPDEVSLTRGSGHNYDLIITISGTETITVVNQYHPDHHERGLEAIEFRDGTVWTPDDILAQTRVNGTSAGEHLWGVDSRYSIDRDNIYGGGGNDLIYGGNVDHFNGDDYLYGGIGNDTLYGGGGSDTYTWSMGEGNDTINDLSRYLTEVDRLVLTDVNSSGVALIRDNNSNSLTIRITSTGEEITVINQYYIPAYGYGLEAIEFSDGVTWLSDDILDNTRTSNTGAVNGTHYNDNLYGLGGNNTLNGLNGKDTLFGGAGADTIQGGDGYDTASYRNATQGVNVDLRITGTQTGDVGDEQLGDVLTSIEGLEGSGFNDTLIGNGSANTLLGLDGDDLFYGGAGADRIDGGAGVDHVSYLNSGAAITVDLRGSNFTDWNPITGGHATGDVLIDIENITGSVYGDTLVGDRHDNTFYGQAGDDTLSGGDGADVLNGGAGNDTLYGQDGADTLYGGVDGDDRLEFGGTTNAAAQYAYGGLGNDTYVIGANSGTIYIEASAEGAQISTDRVLFTDLNLSDVNFTTVSDHLRINWNDGTNSSFAQLGNNGLNIEEYRFADGTVINDFHFGGAGIDTLYGGAGNDFLDGGSGVDTVSYATETSAVGVNLSVTGTDHVWGAAEGDVLTGIENLIGSNYNDTLAALGSGVGSSLYGGNGNDTLWGNNGDDLLVGGSGNDSLNGDAGNDVLIGGTGNNALFGGTGDDVLTATEFTFQLEVLENPISISAINGHDGHLVAGDFNGDGFDDVMFTWEASGQNRLYTSDGDGGFTLSQDPISTGSINGHDGAVITGDFNGDGSDDVMFTWSQTGQNRVFFGNTDGTFSNAFEEIATGAVNGSPDDVVTGDFNGDGNDDVMFFWNASGLNRTFFGQSNGTFVFAENIISQGAINGSDVDVTSGDFDGDGYTDVMFSWHITGANRVMYGNASGTFSDSTNLISASGLASYDGASVSGDFNGDGISDLMYQWSTSGQNLFYLGQVDRSFVEATDIISVQAVNGHDGHLVAGDFNGDGLADELFTWEASGENRLFMSTSGANAFVGGDGVDRVVYQSNGQHLVADLLFSSLNQGSAVGDTYDGIEELQGGAGDDDLRGDNLDNQIIGEAGNDNLHGRGGDDSLYGGDGNDSLIGGTGNNALFGGTGDDVLTATEFTFQLEVLENPISISAINGHDGHLVAGDFNGDGFDDVMFTWEASGQNRLYTSDGDGGFTLSQDPISTGSINGHDGAVITGDFNGDGSDDVMFTWSQTGQNRVFFGNTDGTFSNAFEEIATGAVNGSPDDVVTGDFNGDGNDDVMFFWNASGLNRTFFGQSNGTFVFAENIISQGAINGSDVDVTSGDFDGDGYTDVMFSWHITGANRVMYGNASGTFSDSTNLISVSGLAGYDGASVSGDFNGDGISDLMYQWSTSGQNLFYLGQTDRSFVEATDIIPVQAVNGHDGHLVAGDFNGDGLGDELFTWETSGENRLFMSTSGANAFVGGDGVDRVVYQSNGQHLVADLLFSSLNQGSAVGDTYDGIEELQGGAGDDDLRGDNLDNQIIGEAGNDNLHGRGGDDTLSGGVGNDTLFGGTGADIFIFEDGFGHDVITDFNLTETGEGIDLRAVSAIVNFNDLQVNHLSQSGNDTIINDGNGSMIILNNINMNNLTADDFLFG